MFNKIKQIFYTKKGLFLGGYILGSIIFLCIYGIQVLDITNDAWLLNGGDISQNYIGWQYYRSTPWQFPVGLVDGITYPEKVSIIYTDSITLFAIFFKIFSFILPKTFQYFGLWGIISYGLMGGFSCILLRRYTKSFIICLISSLFFVVSPYVLQRMFSHTSLGGQWIIIAALIAWLYKLYKDNIKKRIFLWCLILNIAALIHIYFIPMIMMIMFLSCVDYFLYSKKIFNSIMQFFFPIISALVVLLAIGAFYGSGKMGSEGLGYFSANLNFLINPIFGISKIFQVRGSSGGQYEGTGYLGAGIFFIGIIALYLLIENKGNYLGKKIYSYSSFILGSFACIIFLILALSPIIMLDNNILLEVPYPNFIMEILSIFRSSGRFVWPICYMIILFIFIILYTYSKPRSLCIILCFAFGLQIYDLSGLIKEKHDKFSVRQEYISNINTEVWEVLAKGKKEIVFIPYDLVFKNVDKIFSIAEFAYTHDMVLNSFYVSRINVPVICSITDTLTNELKSGEARDDILYIFDNISSIWKENYDLEIYRVDNFYIGSRNRVSELDNRSDVEYISSFDTLNINMNDLKVTNEENNFNYKIVRPEQIMYGPYYPLKAGFYKCYIEGQNLNNIELILLGDDGNYIIDFELIRNENELVEIGFTLDKDIDNFQIQIFNSLDVNRYINTVSLIDLKN